MTKKDKSKKTDKKSSATLKHALKTIVWPRRKLLLVGLVLIIINRVAGMALPASTKFLIDDVIVAIHEFFKAVDRFIPIVIDARILPIIVELLLRISVSKTKSK